jgi:hypothetical protein
MVRTAPRCKRHRGREIVLDAKEHQSGEINYTGRISKIGEPMTIIPFSSRFSSWGQEFGQRADDAVGLDRRSRR